MNKERIDYLLKAYQEQTITFQEKTEYIKILHEQRYEGLMNQILDENWNELNPAEVEKVEIPNYDNLLLEIKKQPQQQIKTNVNWWFRIVIAAAVILLVASTTLYYFTNNFDSASTEQFANDIAPGKNGATLTLANGKKILISDALVGNIAKESGIKISKTKDGVLVYEILSTDLDATNAAGHFNTLTTTRGEQIQVKLQDGTTVFLNTESALKYPTSFKNEAKRQVSLTGEAYFEVTKDKAHPFIVAMVSPSGNENGQSVEVLGTSFNISNYADEAIIKTTLLEGSVNVALQQSANGAKQIIKLQPGEQALVSEKMQQVKTVEVEDVVAWKNGYFMFNNETLANIMKKVSRWYNVEVIFNDEAIKQKTFFGSVSRFDHVSEVLKLLQKTEGATFQIKDKQIIVNQKK